MAILFSLATIFHRVAIFKPRAERELLLRARNGERESVEILFNRQREAIFRLCYQILQERESAEDAAQEVLLRAFEKMPSFRGESEFSTWIYRIALNFCLEKQRALARRTALFDGEVENHDSPDFARHVDSKLALVQTLDQLPEYLKIALILREWHHKSYEEIALILGIPVGTVKSRINEARKRFKQLWEAQNGDL